MHVAFFGSSLVSSYWNGAATYYRGLLKALDRLGHTITFYESDAYDRQNHRDLEEPSWARVVVYSSSDQSGLDRCLDAAELADVVVKASGVGVFDDYLESRVPRLCGSSLRIFWDVDAPATLHRMANDRNDPLLDHIPLFDCVLTYGGGDRVVSEYEALGARACVPIYNAVDPVSHHPVEAVSEFRSDLSLMANRLPDREQRIDEFFFSPAARCSEKQFLLGGNGWEPKPMPRNVSYKGHLPTTSHNAFNSSAGMVLNVNRDSMASFGFSPATRVFEAAAAGACLISDDWHGMDFFLEPGREVLIARDGRDVAMLLNSIGPQCARQIGLNAQARVLLQHTYERRADQVSDLFSYLQRSSSARLAEV